MQVIPIPRHARPCIDVALRSHRVVRFCAPAVPACTGMQKQWENLKEEMLERQIFLADVDIGASEKLGQRFGIRREDVPRWVMLRQRAMYLYKQPWDAENFTQWIEEGWEQDDGLPVPPESGGAAELSAVVQEKLRQLLGAILHREASSH